MPRLFSITISFKIKVSESAGKIGKNSAIVVMMCAQSIELCFIAITYIFNIFFSLLLIKRFKTKSKDYGGAIKLGFFIGIFNFIAFYSHLKALSVGPLSIIAPISGMGFVVSIVLSVLVYKEKITKRRAIGIALAILATVLMRI